ncbi:MAG: murein biosynthesis integral membrane protein MurJ [Gammaproteobacteria bacterium]|nr:murein biosynthesis integral membrane protein MurJ [Gammaproteobacteria bacterium]
MTNKLFRSTAIVSLMTFVSRVVGFIRDMVLAHIFGASAGMDAFLLAFKIPNFMRRLFAEGAFSQAFVPVLSEYRSTRSPQDVKALVDKVFGALSAVLFLVTVLGVIGAPLLIWLFAPGFSTTDSRFPLACHLLQITFPYIFFISLTAFAAGVQNAHGKFAMPAFTPVLLNICLIIGAYFFSSYFTQPVTALAWSVMVAGVAQLIFQAPFLAKLALFPSFKLDWRDPGVKRVLTLMSPALIGASVMQINLLVDTIFASFLPVGSLTWLYYSDRLLEFPIGMFGVALATVVLPHLSQEYAKNSHTGFSASVDWALRWILLIGIPATVGLVMMASPLLATLFQYGRFTSHDVIMASRSLIALSMGLVFFLAVKVLVSAFYARQNTKLPVKVAIFAMLANVVLNALLIGPLAHAGLALASSLSSIINVLLLLWVLLREKIYVPMAGWKSFSLRLFISNFAMAMVLWWFSPDVSQWLEFDALERAMLLSGLIGAAVLAYFACLWLAGLRINHLRLESV